MSLFNNNNNIEFNTIIEQAKAGPSNNPEFNRIIARAKAEGKTKNKSSNNGLHPPYIHHQYIMEQQEKRKRQQNQNKANRVFFGLNSENNFVPNPNSSPAKNNKNKNLLLSKKERQNRLNNNNNNPDFNKVIAKAKADGKAKAENNKIQKRLNNLRNIPKNPNNNGKNNNTFTANPLPLIRPGVESVYPLNTNTNTNYNFNLSSINSKKPNLFNNNQAVNKIIANAGPRIQQKNTNRNPKNNTNFFNQFKNSLQVQNLPYQNNMSTPNATHILTHSSKNNKNKNNRTKTRRPRNRRETFNNNLLKNYVELNGNNKVRETFNNNLLKNYVELNGELVRESERKYSKNIPSRSRLKNTRNAITRKTKKGFSLFGRKVKNTSKSISKKTKKGFNSLKRSAKSIKNSFSSKGKSEEKRLQVLNKKIDELNDKIARYLLVQLRAQTTMNPREVNRLTSSGKMIPLNKMNCLINKLRMEVVDLENERNTIVPPNDETCVYQ
jgi:hypothetical protein